MAKRFYEQDGDLALLEGVVPVFERALSDQLRWRLTVPGQGLSRGHLFQRRR